MLRLPLRVFSVTAAMALAMCRRTTQVSEHILLQTMVTSAPLTLRMKKTKIVSSVPPTVTNLLKEYEDIFLVEIPSGLPPMRGIEHQIDLILGATLPNRAAYQTNPEETKEIQWQVQDLLDHGYVHESLSPCAVPVLLVPKNDGT